MTRSVLQIIFLAFCMLASFSLVSASQDKPRAFVQTPFQSSFSSAEMEAFDCNSESSDDSEARFAIQYPKERDSLKRTESSYLLQQQPNPPNLTPTVLSVSTRRMHIIPSVAFIIA